ncbi:hypothetical protein [Aquitalea sp. ASV11]|uniref:hypothetical protein n=1 Tax=Aquitalea sp. ASV11 TaxID=2795103 RepID=UPI0018EBF5E5|nr:hypothetical protein [Aquitalea sp. ASV11]
MSKCTILAFSLLTSLPAWADNINQPDVKAGDKWTYRITSEKGDTGWTQTRQDLWVNRVSSSAIYISSKASGSSLAPKDSFATRDWGVVRQLGGVEVVTMRPFNFPLSVGKSWEVKFTDPHPTNHISEQWSVKYKVLGYEQIEVPAGKFNAMKVEAEGAWSGEGKPSLSVTQTITRDASGTPSAANVVKSTPAGQMYSGRVYKAFWYVPEIKRWVKSIEEYYSNTGERNARYTSELEQFIPASN